MKEFDMRLLTYSTAIAIVAATGMSRAGDGTQAVTFVLDCSRSMSAKMPADASAAKSASRADNTRLDVAKNAITEAIDKLSVDGDNRVGVVLFGHRLAWEQGVSEPDLLEQSQYLEQTLGFEVLKELLPGDDVEIARHIGPFELRDLTMLEARFKVLKPWGEDPLYLAIQKAVETFERSGRASGRHVIVITDGGNNQGMSKHKATKEQVFEALDRKPVPLHIIRLRDDEVERQVDSELGQMARRSGGEYVQAATAAELREHIRGALAVRASRQPAEQRIAATEAVAHASDASSETTAELIRNAVATIKSDAGKSDLPIDEPRLCKLQGSVSYYGIPAKRAKIVLEGEASHVVLRTDAHGNFSIEDVEPGTYTLWTEAIVKNTFRNATRRLKIDNSGRTKTVDLDLQ
jgi:hypothetical protein